MEQLPQTLYPFQLAGVNWLQDVRSSLCLFDEMGLGKTVQSLAALHELDVSTSLVVAPKALLPEWEKAIAEWLPDYQSYRAAGVQHEGQIIGLMNYASLNVVLPKARWDVVVFDEAHYLKNRKSKRSGLARKIARRSERVWLLTGTPPLQLPDETWHLMHLVDPRRFSSYWRFFEKHVKYWSLPNGGKVRTGTRDRKAFVRDIAPYVKRRLKADVLPDLPPLTVASVPAELSQSHRKIYDAVRAGQLVDPEVGPVTFPNALACITALRKIATSPAIALTHLLLEELPNQAIASAKVDVLIEKLPPPQTPFVVFTHFVATKHLVRARLEESGRTTCDVDHIDDWGDEALVDTFYKGGLGLNLQRASHAFFIEPPRSWTWYEQALHRFQRPGGEPDAYYVWRLYSVNTVDEHLFNILDELGEAAIETDLVLAAWQRIQQEI